MLKASYIDTANSDFLYKKKQTKATIKVKTAFKKSQTRTVTSVQLCNKKALIICCLELLKWMSLKMKSTNTQAFNKNEQCSQGVFTLIISVMQSQTHKLPIYTHRNLSFKKSVTFCLLVYNRNRKTR